MLRIGHRGASASEPENTPQSFKRALRCDIDMIELDVFMCKTGEVVVIHDKTVDRTTDGTGRVTSKTLDELRALDAGRGEMIPTLEEVLNIIKRRVAINIELKGKRTAKKVAAIIKKSVSSHAFAYSDFIVSSRKVKKLKQFHRVCRMVGVGVIIPRFSFTKYFSAHLDFISFVVISKKRVSPRYVKYIHARNKKIFVYLIKTKREREKMRRMGVDGIFINVPEKI